jgi:TRAP-type mannitol/chloroaromatic compound transport system permease small subunit
MAATVQTVELNRIGNPALVIRSIGWVILGALVAFLINNVLNVGFGVPQVTQLFSGGAIALVPWVVYAVCVAIALAYVLRSRDTALRWDARQIHRFNIFLVRWFFWSVLLIGIADSAIAFMRVERFLDLFMEQDMVRNLGQSRFVGPYIHAPLALLSFVIAFFTRTLGFIWLALLIAGSELLIVITRFVFSYEQALMGDLVRYWYAALFLFASAYTLFDEGHVRVDVLYAGLKSKTRGFVNAIGSLALGASTAWVIIVVGMNGRTSIINSPVLSFEVTQTGSVGMFVKYQMAIFLGIFAVTMLIQFVSYFFESVADYREEPGHVEHENPAP